MFACWADKVLEEATQYIPESDTETDDEGTQKGGAEAPTMAADTQVFEGAAGNKRSLGKEATLAYVADSDTDTGKYFMNEGYEVMKWL